MLSCNWLLGSFSALYTSHPGAVPCLSISGQTHGDSRRGPMPRNARANWLRPTLTRPGEAYARCVRFALSPRSRPRRGPPYQWAVKASQGRNLCATGIACGGCLFPRSLHARSGPLRRRCTFPNAPGTMPIATRPGERLHRLACP